MTEGPTLVNCFVLTTASLYTVAMRLLKRAPVLALAALIACAPPALYYKPGASPVQIESNLTNGEVAALGKVPRDIRTRFIPAQYSTRTYCNSYGRCYPRTYLVQPARTESYDANAALRGRVTEQCIAEAGYRPVSLPQCDPAEVRLATLPADPAQPPLGPGSCALRLPSGKWRIVTLQ